jgi:hypothetical protein
VLVIRDPFYIVSNTVNTSRSKLTPRGEGKTYFFFLSFFLFPLYAFKVKTFSLKYSEKLYSRCLYIFPSCTNNIPPLLSTPAKVPFLKTIAKLRNILQVDIFSLLTMLFVPLYPWDF